MRTVTRMAGAIGMVMLMAWALGLAACASRAEDALVLYHADFHARLGQKIYVEVGEGGAAQLVAELAGDNGTKSVLLDKRAPLAAEEVVVVKQRDLPKGTYTLTVRLLDKAGKTLRQAARTFSKPYDGPPKVGIDEQNAICVDGKPFFPVAPWGLGQREIGTWANKYVNALCHIGFGPEKFDIADWKSYLDEAARHNVKVIGPMRGDYWPGRAWNIRYQDAEGKWQRHKRVDIERLAEFVAATRDHPALLAWSWHDEPDLGGRNEYIPATEVRRWTDKCHELDAQHPTFLNISGYMFTKGGQQHANQLAQSYCYLFGDRKTPPMGDNEPFAAKTACADALSFDYYPYEYRLKFDWITLGDFALALDHMRQWNHDLLPYFSCVETCDIKAKPTDRPATPSLSAAQLRNLIWINVVHGARGIVWFHHFEPTPAENYKEMERFVEQVSRLGPAILGPRFSGSVAADAAGKGRVDVMATEHDGKLYLFAASIPEGREFQAADEGGEFKARLSVAGLPAGAKITVIDEERTLEAAAGGFEDAFGPYGVHLYAIDKW